MHLSFVGDFLPNGTTRSALDQADDCIIANLECALRNTRVAARKAYSLVIQPEALADLKEQPIKAVNVANNHVYDTGEDSFLRMVDMVEKQLAVSCYGLRDKPYIGLDVDSTRCVIIGCLERCRARGRLLFPEEMVESLISKIRGDFNRLFVTPHWGKEGEFAHHPSPRQQRLARRWIDAGADGVFGHHSHTIHGAEWYKGKPIYYSLGNYQLQIEQNAAYPLSAFGLMVHWHAGCQGEPDQYRLQFLAQDEKCIQQVSMGQLEVMREFFKLISAELSKPVTMLSYWRWARRIGPIYIQKSWASWALRLRQHGIRTVPLWIAWLLHPKTLLLWAASSAPDHEFFRNLQQTCARVIDCSSLEVSDHALWSPYA